MKLEIKFSEEKIKEIANEVLDGFEYNGKTIRQWANSVAKPITNADRIRLMDDDELTELLYAWHLSTFCKKKEWIHNWLKKEVKDE